MEIPVTEVGLINTSGTLAHASSGGAPLKVTNANGQAKRKRQPEPGDTVHLTMHTMDIMDAIYHLLRKQRHVESHQLLSYVPSDTLGELNTGSWWKETQDALCLQSHMHLLPIILFSDGTLLDNAGVINGDIIAIRLGNLPLEMYVKTDNCQVLGLMPSDPCATKAQKAARKRLGALPGTKSLILHECLQRILAPVQQVAKDGGFWYRRTDKSYIKLVPCCPFYSLDSCEG